MSSRRRLSTKRCPTIPWPTTTTVRGFMRMCSLRSQVSRKGRYGDLFCSPGEATYTDAYETVDPVFGSVAAFALRM
ncbi:hypothetical protein GCM10023201_19500 [Actinomycetospora corticicola]